MVRSKMLAVVILVSACSMQAMDKKSPIIDTARIAAGATAGVALQIGGASAFEFLCHGTDFGVRTASNIYRNDGTTIGFSWDNVYNSKMTPVWAALGTLVGVAYTTYGRTLRAQFNLAFSNTYLLTVVTAQYDNDAQLVRALEKCCLNFTYPLVGAKKVLADKLVELSSATCLIQEALENISADSSRAKALNAWLDEIYALYAQVSHAASTVENDPRLPAMLEAQNKKDIADARMIAATAEMMKAVLGTR